MGTLKDRVEAELENVERALAALPAGQPCSQLSTLELTGVAALLHSFYNGVENILKQVIAADGSDLPQGDSWHRELIDLAVSTRVIGQSTADALRPYLAFRHFFVHGYAVDLQPERIQPLVEGASGVGDAVRGDVADTSAALTDLHSSRTSDRFVLDVGAGKTTAVAAEEPPVTVTMSERDQIVLRSQPQPETEHGGRHHAPAPTPRDRLRPSATAPRRPATGKTPPTLHHQPADH